MLTWTNTYIWYTCLRIQHLLFMLQNFYFSDIIHSFWIICLIRDRVRRRNLFHGVLKNKMVVERILGSSQRLDLASPLFLLSIIVLYTHTHTHTRAYFWSRRGCDAALQPVHALSWVVFRRSCSVDCPSFLSFSLSIDAFLCSIFLFDDISQVLSPIASNLLQSFVKHKERHINAHLKIYDDRKVVIWLYYLDILH